MPFFQVFSLMLLFFQVKHINYVKCEFDHRGVYIFFLRIRGVYIRHTKFVFEFGLEFDKEGTSSSVSPTQAGVHGTMKPLGFFPFPKEKKEVKLPRLVVVCRCCLQQLSSPSDL